MKTRSHPAMALRNPLERRRVRIFAAVVVVAALAGCSSLSLTPEAPGLASRLEFAVVGDMGYEPAEEPAVERVFADLNRASGLAFVVHVGDLSAPRYACAGPLRGRRLAQFQASAHPLVFTPGDNDWTDCHPPAVPDGNPLERLADLRAAFFKGERTLGRRTFPLIRQSDGDAAFAKYRENVRWSLGGVTFLTLHLPGSNNGLGRTPEGDAEYADRNEANLAWLRQGFERAAATNSRAIVIMQQANLFPEFPPFPDRPRQPSGYADVREALRREALRFARPVLLIHGDSHFFRLDKPLSPMRERGKPVTTMLENLTRLETFGSPYHHWVHVTIEPGDPGVFTVRPRLVVENLRTP